MDCDPGGSSHMQNSIIYINSYSYELIIHAVCHYSTAWINKPS